MLAKMLHQSSAELDFVVVSQRRAKDMKLMPQHHFLSVQLFRPSLRVQFASRMFPSLHFFFFFFRFPVAIAVLKRPCMLQGGVFLSTEGSWTKGPRLEFKEAAGLISVLASPSPELPSSGRHLQ